MYTHAVIVHAWYTHIYEIIAQLVMLVFTYLVQYKILLCTHCNFQWPHC